MNPEKECQDSHSKTFTILKVVTNTVILAAFMYHFLGVDSLVNILGITSLGTGYRYLRSYKIAFEEWAYTVCFALVALAFLFYKII